jgi:hypothetical protein
LALIEREADVGYRCVVDLDAKPVQYALCRVSAVLPELEWPTMQIMGGG